MFRKIIAVAFLLVGFTVKMFSMNIWEAARSGNLDQVTSWIENVGIDVDKENDYGETPLFYAVYGNSAEVAEYLIDNGADVNHTNDYGNSILYNAITYRSDEILELLLDNGADVEEQGISYWTPLMEAVYYGYSSAVELLLQNGADVNATDYDGTSALEYAIIYADYETVEILIEYGADISVTFSERVTDLYTYEKEFNILEYAVKQFIRMNGSVESALMLKYLYDYNQDLRSGQKLSLDEDVPDTMNPDLVLRLMTVLGNKDNVVEALKNGSDPEAGNPSSVELAMWCERDDILSYYEDMGFLGDTEFVADIEEGADIDLMTWATSENAPWEIDRYEYYQSQDRDSLKAGTVDHEQTSFLETSFMGSQISFYWMTSCEDGYDYLNFYIDGRQMASLTGFTDWEYQEFSVSEGIHTVRWEYAKDGSVSEGQDTAWIDAVYVE